MTGDELAASFPNLEREARAKWPGVEVASATFWAYVAERADDGVERLHVADLYLACACAAGDPAAFAAFERTYLRDAEIAAQSMGKGTAFVDEILQLLRSKLFVASEGEVPRIVDYSGRSDLKSWFRVVATREALSALRRHKREVPLEGDEFLRLATGKAADPELSHLFERHARDFHAAFADALAGLSTQERNLLRHHYVDGLSIDGIGAIYRIHRVTASRQLNKARERLVESTRTLLADRLRLTDSELGSLLGVLQSGVELSLRRLLLEPSVKEPSS